MEIPDWLASALEREADPAQPQGLLFHGTIEPFEGPLRPTGWEGLLWFSDSPIVSQSYCAAAGLSALWSFQSWRSADRFVPIGDLDEKLFAGMGHDIEAMEIQHGRDGRPESYRILESHPTYADVATYVTETLGYHLRDGSCWITLKHDQVQPASWKEQGRLYILKKPDALQLYDMRKQEGGLAGRQWMETEQFANAREAGYDGVIISDVHQTERLGHYGHTSWGLFGETIERLDVHDIPCTFFDPADAWYGSKARNTPEWLDLIKHLEMATA